MLKSLTVNNVVLIDKIAINFSKGLSILTGETGSGKSILLDALGLAIGFRSNSRLIGKNDNKSSVIAEFDISSNPPCQEILALNDITNHDNHLIIRRTISESSNNKIFVNDIPVSLNLLAKIGEALIEINGQHEQHGLLSSANHLDILDEFSGNQQLLSELKKVYNELSNIDKQIEEVRAKADFIAREIDYLEHSIKEISGAKIEENEEELLVQKKDQLVAKEKINNFIGDLKNSLSQANSSLFQAQKFLSRNFNLVENFLKNHAEQFEQINSVTESNIAQIEDSITNLEKIHKEVNNFHESKEEIEERLFFIRSLSRKFNCPTRDLAGLEQDFTQKLNELIKDQNSSNELNLAKTELLKKYKKYAQELSVKRQKSALELAKKVEGELEFLKMKGTRFLVEIVANQALDGEKQYFANGLEKVKFKASLNKGDFDEINKIASGGELSRFMLALKVALMNVKSTPTIIFDEIDTGISGSTSDAVGKRLKMLAQNAQILAVTHQPQIACKAHAHFKIAKIDNENGVKTQIYNLGEAEKISELARMLSGENISAEAIEVAKNLVRES